MKYLVKYFTHNPYTIVAVTAKEQEWKIDIAGKYLYKLTIHNEDKNIEVYFRVLYHNVAGKKEKIPFCNYINNLSAFIKNKEDISGIFKPIKDTKNSYAYSNLESLLNNIKFIHSRKITNFKTQYIVKSVLKNAGIDYEVYLVLNDDSIDGKMKIIKEDIFFLPSKSEAKIHRIINVLRRKL